MAMFPAGRIVGLGQSCTGCRQRRQPATSRMARNNQINVDPDQIDSGNQSYSR